MTRRTILLWMGLLVLFALTDLPREALAGQTYQVQPGDTLAGISKRVGVTAEALAKANNLRGNLIKPKQLLTVPSPDAPSPARKNSATNAERTPSAAKSARSGKASADSAVVVKTSYRVGKGDTLSKIAAKTGVSTAQLRELNTLKGDKLRIGQTLRLQRKGAPAAVPPETTEVALLRVSPDLEEEEGDGGPTQAEAWKEIERRKQENAALLGQWTTPEEPKLLVKVATGFLGAPYRLGGSSVTGLDCSAFVKKIYDMFNITLPRTAFEQARVGLPVPRSDLAEGDLIFFNTRRAFGHVGIYIGNNEFVHASSRNRKVRVDNLASPYFDKRFVRAVRVKGADEGL